MRKMNDDYLKEIPDPKDIKYSAERNINEDIKYQFIRKCVNEIRNEKTTCILTEYYANLFRQKGYTVKKIFFPFYKITWEQK